MERMKPGNLIKTPAFRKMKNMENNLRCFARSRGCGYCQPFSVQTGTLGKDLRYEVIVSNVMVNQYQIGTLEIFSF